MPSSYPIHTGAIQIQRWRAGYLEILANPKWTDAEKEPARKEVARYDRLLRELGRDPAVIDSDEAAWQRGE